MTARQSATSSGASRSAALIDSVRQALIEGEQSGEPEPFDFAAFKQRKAAQHG